MSDNPYLHPKNKPASDQPDMKLTIGGEVFGLGLQVPEGGPKVSFLSSPPEKLFTLDELKTLYKNTNLKDPRELYSNVKQQGRASSCASYAATTACEMKRSFDSKEKAVYQPEALYARVSGGQDAGSLLDHNMRALLEFGCCLEFEKLYQKHSFNSLSMEEKRHVEQQGMDYRALDWATCPIGDVDKTWHHMICGIARRNPALLAVHCDDSFFRAGADGKFPAARGRKAVGNHGTVIVGLDKSSVLQASSFRDIVGICQNSHGKRWGAKGYYMHTFAHSEVPMNYHQTCLCVSMRTSPDEDVSTLID